MTKYRKKPVVIEALQWTGDNVKEMRAFLGGAVADIVTVFSPVSSADSLPDFLIKTLEGDMLASRGDYIIKGVNGEFYPCKPDIFVKTYEKVEEE